MVILDENVLLTNLQSSYLDLGALEPSPSHSLMAYAIDSSGYETYDIYIESIPVGKDTEGKQKGQKEDGQKGHECREILTECGGEVVW